MKHKLIFFTLTTSLFFQLAAAQQPLYTIKQFVSIYDTSEFKNAQAPKNGFGRNYILTEPETWDTDDNNTTHVRGGGRTALVCIEGMYKAGKKNGIFSFFLIDSSDHSRRFKIWEQTYVNDKLNGQWKTYNLKGTLIRVQNFKNDSLNGISRNYWIDGQTIIEEQEYFNGRNKFLIRTFYKSGKIETEQSFENGVINGISKSYYENGIIQEQMTMKNDQPNGPAKKFYEDGTLKEEVTLVNGKFDKIRKYYHPNGQLWIEQEYLNGLPWTVIANYDEKGNRRNAGSLKDGNGTLILYNEHGTIRETLTYVNGIQQ